MSNDIGNGRVGLDDIHQFLNRVVHDRKRCVLRSSHVAHNHARILLRKESLWDNNDKIKVQRNGEQQQGQHGRWML